MFKLIAIEDVQHAGEGRVPLPISNIRVANFNHAQVRYAALRGKADVALKAKCGRE
jgi:hypothetical protein